ncbi:unnamed protein product [Symbiodinium natans]|uniref:Uncharacterized protein n=1 Tax=Symbiodinium natans TaxID=878477 RepID=A0A812IEM1_9DINO|nr:unnamed protein product [Symbiodinium natans]
MSMSSSQMWWYKIDQQQAHYITFEENDIVATVKEKFISKSPSLKNMDPGQIIIRKASGEELQVDSKISQLVIQGVGTDPRTAVLVAGETSVAAGVATHPRVAPAAAVERLSLCEEALGQVQPWQWIWCRITYRSTDVGIKSRLSDHMRTYSPGTLGGTLQRRKDVTVVTIEGTHEIVRSVLTWMERMPYPRDEVSKRLIHKAKHEQFLLLRSCPEPRSENSSGNVAEEGTSASSLSDASTPSRIS